MTPHSAYDAWHERLAVDDGADAPWHRLIREHLNPKRDLAEKTVLEIGCGRGGFSCWLAAGRVKPMHITAADFSETAVQKGKRFAESRGLSNVRWEVADIQAIPHPDRSFDTVFSCETIEHVPSPRRAVAELARVLRPGGRLFLTTPNYLSTIGLYRLYVSLTGRLFTECGQPINNLTMLPLTCTWIRDAGLTIRIVDGIGHYLPIPGRPPISLAFLDKLRQLTRWIAHHPLIVAEKR